ncbi:hydantoinase B/oxoprolinase family protein [Pseudodesulfovibrio thermohalotolerans]|uniref:hydantoinase B/oxoprolinase family protein n=1 Tax=Pseudodesulfovibrio thermohalotolerans TaxID=2880651 RepID=UPI00244354BC|nr:hydantoinase B/oxoprolinase family protein [Pseudodesulfovibrio thermohalotolerans]WFS63745.1 hydantoinase B/oxoprolinase family protein [Pseudodesulfovibrio thermohalotolerans]
MQTNPILLEVFKNRFSSIAEEMGVTLTHTAFSPNIKERRDLSCAVFDANGDMIAQAAHIPVHLGSMPLSVKAAMAAMEEQDGFAPGDMVMLNDPFKGGTHLPDITIVAPVFASEENEPAFFVANRAHHADVGGMASGSMPLSVSLFQEGLIIPPVRIVRGGKTDTELMRLILNNVRTPLEREGDFSAQFMANVTGVRRMTECIAKYGLDTCAHYARALMDYSERITRRAVSSIPDGTYSFEDFLEDDGQGTTDIAIRLTMTVEGDHVQLDFSGSDDQVRGSVNAVRAITLSAVLYVFRALAGRDIPANAGCMRPLTVMTRPGSVVDAAFPAAVAGGNVETSQRLVDVLLGALAQALPRTMPAASQGTMNNLTIGGRNQNTPFAYYETLGGGMGAGPAHDGESAVHSHMTNTLNTPIEALEYAYPFRVREYAIRRGTGGQGQYDGGDGLVRELEMLADAEITVLSERRAHAPFGVNGGQPGSPGENVVISRGVAKTEPGKFHRAVRAGDRVRMETPGGGGYGEPNNS